MEGLSMYYHSRLSAFAFSLMLCAPEIVCSAEDLRRLPLLQEEAFRSETILPEQTYFQDTPPPVDLGPPIAPPEREFRLFQKPSAKVTWLAGGGDDGLGLAEVNASISTAIPPFVFGSLIIVTPSLAVTTVDQPSGLGLPSELYLASASFLWMNTVSDRLKFMAIVTPGVSSDFRATEDSFQLFALGVVTYQRTPEIQYMFGAVHTGRSDIPVFPVLGLVWTPHEDLRVEVTLPRPRVARRVYGLSQYGSDAEDWIYFAGELGGGTWAVERPSGDQDLLTIRDFRLVLGFERKTAFGLQANAELGYVFGRSIEFEHDPTEFEPTNTLMLRTGFSF